MATPELCVTVTAPTMADLRRQRDAVGQRQPDEDETDDQESDAHRQAARSRDRARMDPPYGAGPVHGTQADGDAARQRRQEIGDERGGGETAEDEGERLGRVLAHGPGRRRR